MVSICVKSPKVAKPNTETDAATVKGIFTMLKSCLDYLGCCNTNSMVSIFVKSPKVEKANTVIVTVTIIGIFAKLKNCLGYLG